MLASAERRRLLDCNEESLCALFAVMSFREASALRRTCRRLYSTTLATGFASFWRSHRSAAERRDINKKSAVTLLPLMERSELEAASLETHGFRLLCMELSDKEIEAVKDAKCSYPIPNAEDENGVNPGDGTRTQSHHQLRKEINDLKGRVTHTLEDAGYMRTSRTQAACNDGRCCVSADETRPRFWCCKRCVNARVLKSVPGPSGRGDDQPAHCDAAPPRSFEQPKPSEVEPPPLSDWPLSVLLAVQEDTYLAILKRGDAHFTLLRYGVGDIILFRGDICHYGVGYDCKNSRLHFYVDSHVGRPPNVVIGGC